MKNVLLLFALLQCGFVKTQIISFDTNDTIIYDIVNDTPGSSTSIDVNFDGIVDFELYIQNNNGHYLGMYGVTDSADIIHREFSGSNFSGYELINMTDSTLNDDSPWMFVQQNSPTASNGLGMFHWTIPGYVSHNLNSNYYVGFRFFLEGTDFIYRPHYGCMDVTLTLDERLIVHGWAYESQPNTPITCSDSALVSTNSLQDLSSNSKQKKVFKIFDAMGRETKFKPNTLLIYLYDDGTSERVMMIRD